VTLQPVNRYDTDAAILFSDILVVPYALGQTLDFVEGEGPRLGALPTPRDFENLCFDGFDKRLEPVYETIKKVRARLAPEKALIGFAGAPWTIACYMIQGQGDGEFTAARVFAMTQTEAFESLLDRITEATSIYLLHQIRAGADAVQLFDSWAGLLPETLFQRWVIEPTRKIVSRLREQYPDTPVIGFPRRAGGLYAQYAMKTGVSCVGLDTQAPLGWALRECGKDICLQGNLDPVCLLAGGKILETETLRILDLVRGRPFIFNLGHGVLRETPPEHVERLAEIIKSFRR
jgi:uroporphyrinogen decarboxylase